MALTEAEEYRTTPQSCDKHDLAFHVDSGEIILLCMRCSLYLGAESIKRFVQWFLDYQKRELKVHEVYAQNAH